MELYLVRHGLTAWNRDRICQGQTDIPLSDEGRAQAAALAERLSSTSFDAAWSSDLSRAHETARIVLEGADVALQTSSDLREMGFGEWEGHDLGELFGRFPEQRDGWQNAPAEWRPPGGECLGEVQARMAARLDGLVDGHPDGRVLVVSHGFAILTYVCKVIGLSIERFRHLWLDPTSITELRFGGRVPILKRHNDHAHLG
jgi:phosphoserine phosphatase